MRSSKQASLTASERAADQLEPGWTWRVVDVPTTFSETWREHVGPIPLDDDLVNEVNGVRVFVDGFSAQYLTGITIDYVTSMQGSGFTFNNPNATGGCGCGSSFTA